MNTMQKLSQLRRLMQSIESDLGIETFSECEKNLIAVISDQNNEKLFTSSEITTDELLRNHSRPTIFRSIASLIDRGLIERVGQSKSGVYRILKDF
jgi:predicted HTH transcriptional regulator